MEAVNLRLGRTLRAWRRKRGLKISSMAAELGVSTATWAYWESGAKFPAAKHLNLLSQYLGIPVCRLFCCATGKCGDCTTPDRSSRPRHSTKSGMGKVADYPILPP